MFPIYGDGHMAEHVWMNMSDAARALGVSTEVAKRLVRTGHLRAVKRGRQWRIRADSVYKCRAIVSGKRQGEG